MVKQLLSLLIFVLLAPRDNQLADEQSINLSAAHALACLVRLVLGNDARPAGGLAAAVARTPVAYHVTP